MEPRQGSLLRLLVTILAFDDFLELLSQHGAHAGTTLGGKGASLFQERFVEGESDVLLHKRTIPVYT